MDEVEGCAAAAIMLLLLLLLPAWLPQLSSKLCHFLQQLVQHIYYAGFQALCHCFVQILNVAAAVNMTRSSRWISSRW
jgi:hypothetical protein